MILNCSPIGLQISQWKDYLVTLWNVIGLFFIPFIDGLRKTQNGEKTSTYKNTIRSIDEFGLIGELLSGAIGAWVTVAIAGYGALLLLLEVFHGIFGWMAGVDVWSWKTCG